MWLVSPSFILHSDSVSSRLCSADGINTVLLSNSRRLIFCLNPSCKQTSVSSTALQQQDVLFAVYVQM